MPISRSTFFCDVFGIDLTLALDLKYVLIVATTSERVSNVWSVMKRKYHKVCFKLVLHSVDKNNCLRLNHAKGVKAKLGQTEQFSKLYITSSFI